MNQKILFKLCRFFPRSNKHKYSCRYQFLLFFGFCTNCNNGKTLSTAIFTWPCSSVKNNALFLASLEGALCFWPFGFVFTFILAGRINTSDLIYIFSTSCMLIVVFPFHLSSVVSKSQNPGSACAGRTAALCQFSSIRQTSRFLAKSNQVAQIAQGTVGWGCQLPN